MTVSEAAALAEIERRQRATPLAYARLWHRALPRTSQRRALRTVTGPDLLMGLILGGNRTGKTEVAAMWAVAQAAGRDAVHMRGKTPVRWVQMWLAVNGLPDGMVPNGPGRVWVASPTFAAAVEQIRPKIARWSPEGTRFRAWGHKGGEGEVLLPGGGIITSKAYRQYDSDPQTWEGANIRAAVLDEQPNSYANLSALFSRLVDQRGRALGALTPLRGRADWLYQELVKEPPEWLRIAYLYGADNPHIPQDWRDLMLASVPEWQRASRDKGAFTSPEGAIFRLDPNLHDCDPFEVPPEWLRWVGIDWGGRAPHVVWAAQDPKDGMLYVYRELAPRRDQTQPAISDRQLVEWARQHEEGSPDAGQATILRVVDSENPGAVTEALSQGYVVIPATKGPGSVLEGYTMLESLLQTTDPITMQPCLPRIRLMRGRCPVLRAELEGIRWAEERPGRDPHPHPADPDHGVDALRYIVQMRPSLGLG